jgi:TonB family protein
MNSQSLSKRVGFRSLTRRAVPRIALAALLLPCSALHAQESRKVKSSTPPEYPDLAKRLGIKGIVRVQLTVAPDGGVKDVKELGGNPVLIEALVRAVKKWKYQPANETSTLEVKVYFGPQ